MKKPTAAERALAAMKKHGKLVRNKNYYGEWQTPQGSHICGTVTIKRLVDAGLAMFVPGGVEPTARVLREESDNA